MSCIKPQIIHVKIPIQQRKTKFLIYKIHGMKNIKRMTVDQDRNHTFNEKPERFSRLYKME